MTYIALSARSVSKEVWEKLSRNQQVEYLKQHPKSGYRRFGVKNDSGNYSFSNPESGPRQAYNIGIPTHTRIGGRVEDGFRAILHSTGYTAAGVAGISFANIVSKNMQNVTGQVIDTTTDIAAALNKGIAEGVGSILKTFTDSSQTHNIDWIVQSAKSGIDSGAGSLASDVKSGLIGNHFDRLLTAAAKTSPDDLINGAIQLVQDHPYGVGGALLIGAALLYRRYRRGRQISASDDNATDLDKEFKDPVFAKFFTLYLAMGLNGALEKKKDTQMVSSEILAADRVFWNSLTRSQQIQYLREHKKSAYRKFGIKRDVAPGNPSNNVPKHIVNTPSQPAQKPKSSESKPVAFFKATTKSIGVAGVLLGASGVAQAVKENMPNLINGYKSVADNVKAQLPALMAKQNDISKALDDANMGHEAYKSMLEEGVKGWTAFSSYMLHIVKGGKPNDFIKNFDPSSVPAPKDSIVEKLAEMKVNPFQGSNSSDSLYQEFVKNEDQRSALTKQFAEFSSQLSGLKGQGAEAAKKIADTSYFDSMWQAVKDISPEKVLDNVTNIITTYPLEVGGVVAVGAAAAYILARRRASKNKIQSANDEFIGDIQKLINDKNFGQVMLGYVMGHLADAGANDFAKKSKNTNVEAKLFTELARRPVNKDAWNKLSRTQQQLYLKQHKDSGYKKLGVKQDKGNGTSVTNPVPNKTSPDQEKKVEDNTNKSLNDNKPVDPHPQETKQGNKLVNKDQARALIKPGSQNRKKIATAVQQISSPESMNKLKSSMKPEDYAKLNDYASKANDSPGIMSQIMPTVLLGGAAAGLVGSKMSDVNKSHDQINEGDFSGAFHTLTDATGSLSDRGRNYLNNVKNNFDSAYNTVNMETALRSGKTIDQHMTEIKTGIDNLLVNSLPEKAAPYIKSVQDNTASLIQDLNTWKTSADEKVQPVIDNMIKNAQDSYDHVYNMAHTMANSIASKGGNAGEAIQGFVQSSGLDQMAHNASQAISNGASYAGHIAQSIGNYAGEDAKQIATSSVAQSVSQFVGDNLRTITSFIPAIASIAGGASVGHVAMIAGPVLLAGAAAYIGYKAIKNRQKPEEIYAENKKEQTAGIFSKKPKDNGVVALPDNIESDLENFLKKPNKNIEYEDNKMTIYGFGERGYGYTFELNNKRGGKDIVNHLVKNMGFKLQGVINNRYMTVYHLIKGPDINAKVEILNMGGGYNCMIEIMAETNRTKAATIDDNEATEAKPEEKTKPATDKSVDKNTESPAVPETTNTSNNTADHTAPLATMFQGLSDTIANDPGYMGYMEKFINGQAPVNGTVKPAQTDGASPSDTKTATNDPGNTSKSVTASYRFSIRAAFSHIPVEVVAKKADLADIKTKTVFKGSMELQPWVRDFIDRVKISYVIQIGTPGNGVGYLLMECNGNIKDPEEILSIILDEHGVDAIADNKFALKQVQKGKTIYTFKMGKRLAAELNTTKRSKNLNKNTKPSPRAGKEITVGK